MGLSDYHCSILILPTQKKTSEAVMQSKVMQEKQTGKEEEKLTLDRADERCSELWFGFW